MSAQTAQVAVILAALMLAVPVLYALCDGVEKLWRWLR